ncbi:MAG: heme-binding protein [Deltaproteobacteria bacterium]
MTTLDVPLQDSSLLVQRDAERNSLSRQAQRMRRVNRASLALPALGVATGTWLLARGAKDRSAGLAALGASIGLGLVRWQLQRWVTESIAYEVKATLGKVELRKYPAQVWAETVVHDSTWNESLHEGFRRLAAYIFGANNEVARLTMTAPVLSSYAAGPRAGEQIDMAAPVMAELGDTGDLLDRTVAFVMPADRELATLPAPHDRRVRLREVHPRLVAALRFRGNYESGLPNKKREELLQRLREAGIATRGEARFAGYDPPTTWSPLRRNEVLVDLDEA